MADVSSIKWIIRRSRAVNKTPINRLLQWSWLGQNKFEFNKVKLILFVFILFLVLYVLFLFDIVAVVRGLYVTNNTISRKIIEVYDDETDTWNINASRKFPIDGVEFGQGTD